MILRSALALLAMTLSAVPLSGQPVYETDFESTGDPSGVSYPTGPLTAGGWTTQGTVSVSDATDGAANGTQFVEQSANSSLRQDITTAEAPTLVLMRGYYKGTGDADLVAPAGAQPVAAVVAFRSIDQDSLTIAAYDGQAEDWVESNGFNLATDTWHKVIVLLNYADGAKTYSISANDVPVLSDVPFHSNAVSTLNGFESTSGVGSSVDTIGLFVSDGDYDNDGVSDAEELATEGADPFDPYKPNANAAPTVIALVPPSVSENLPSGTTVGALSSTDVNPSDSFTYELVAGEGDSDNGSFTISGGSILTAASFDFEAKSSYTIRVQSTDSGGLSFAQAISITITDANDAPSAPGLDNNTVAENQIDGALVGQLSATDPDAGDTVSFSLVSGQGGDDNSSFAIDGSNLVTAVPFDFEARSSYSVRIRATDGGGLFDEAVYTIVVTDVNDAPTLVAVRTNTVAEDAIFGTEVGILETTDEDQGDTFVYTLVAGEGDSDNLLFSITDDQLLTASLFDFETQDEYSIRVRSADSGGLFVEAIITINITDVNEAPTSISFTQPTPVSENATIGTLVGTLSSVDPDSADTAVYTLVAGEADDHNTSFTLSNNQVLVAAALDFETVPVASIRVRTTDSGGLFIEDFFSIEIADEEEVPPTLASTEFTIPENEPEDTFIGTLSVANAGSFSFDTFELLPGLDAALLTLDGQDLRSAVSYDFEQTFIVTARVRISGEGAPTIEEEINVRVTNVNEAPHPLRADPFFGAEENAPIGSTMANLLPAGPFSQYDPDDAEEIVTITIVPEESENDGLDFAVDGYSIVSTRVFNYEEQNSYVITVDSTDNEGLSTRSTITINITDMPDAPTAVALSNNQINVGAAVGTAVGNFSTEDEDEFGGHTYSLVEGDGDDDNGLFRIGTGGVLEMGVRVTEPGNYSIRVRSQDDFPGLFIEDSFTIILNDTSNGWVLF